MANLGYVNRFGSGVNTVASLLEENGSKPAQFLLGDMTTFKVVVTNADVIEKEGDVTVKKLTVIVNVTDDDSTSGTNSDADGTMRNDDWNDLERLERSILERMKQDKRISLKQLSKLYGKSKTSMFRIVEKLKTDGKIRRIGSEKSGTWEVIS